VAGTRLKGDGMNPTIEDLKCQIAYLQALNAEIRMLILKLEKETENGNG
jgi:hypothetical protein